MKTMVDPRYEAIAARSPAAEGTFWYGVRTTGVYCRPTCKSRLPRPENVEFFTHRRSAERAGFRACLRCKPQSDEAPDTAREQTLAACRIIESAEGILTLAELGERLGLSPAYVQRTFKRITGVSPREYADALRKSRLKSNLQTMGGVASATYESGYGSSSRVYERAADTLGMTPARYRRRGDGLTISFSIVSARLGFVLIATTPRGICAVRLGDDPQALEAELRREFEGATIARHDEAIAQTARAVCAYIDNQAALPQLPLDVRATAFQERVWQALRAIGPGTTKTYSQIASELGSPKSARAVARACAANPVAVVIPCHRVVPKGRRNRRLPVGRRAKARSAGDGVEGQDLNSSPASPSRTSCHNVRLRTVTMDRIVLARLSAVLLFALAGCGSENSSSTPAHYQPPTAPPSAVPTPTPPPAATASATISFKVPIPPAEGSSSSKRARPQFISPGSNFLNILIDGTLAFDAVQIYTYTAGGATYSYTSADKNTTATLSGVISGAYFVWTIAIDTLPGKHTFGINITGNIPPIILSEGQATYTLAPGPNTPQTLSLNGVVGSSYVECDTAANIALNNGCAGSFNASTGYYTLTAVAADFEGFPIANQGIPFDNGTFSVIETTSPKILTLLNTGPFAQPGTQLTGPSGSWYVPGTFTYGQPFQVKCNSLGSATLALTISNNGPTTPLTGFTYVTYVQPNPTAGSNYPGIGTLPVGSKTTNSHGNANVVTNLSNVNCDASLNLTLN